MDAETIKFSRIIEVGRDFAIFGDVVIRATIINKHEVKIEGEIGGDVGRRLRIDRAKRKRKVGRPGYPKPRADD